MALKYDHSKNAAMQFGFLNELPQNLKIELSLIMHKEIIKKIFFFSGKPAHFIAFIGPLLKPLHVEDGTYIYKEKDPIEEIFFLIKGKAAFVHKDIKDSCYLIIESGYYFGEIDFVFQNNDGKRKFTVKA
jgi:CRP-like cAMP-binding protein